MRRADVIVDSSVWIDDLSGHVYPTFVRAFAEDALVISPLVIAEVLSGNITLEQRAIVGEILQDFPVHPTPLGHSIAVGELRRMLRTKASTSRSRTLISRNVQSSAKPPFSPATTSSPSSPPTRACASGNSVRIRARNGRCVHV
jgi:predicted nucleic acid-binding protein